MDDMSEIHNCLQVPGVPVVTTTQTNDADMELLPTLQSVAGTLSYGPNPRQRLPAGKPQWISAFKILTKSRSKSFLSRVLAKAPNGSRHKPHGRFLVDQVWDDIPHRLRQLVINKTLPADPHKKIGIAERNIVFNLIEITKPIKLEVVKSYVLDLHRVDIEQAVALVLRLLPEHRADLVSLVPTIMTQSCMWLESPLVGKYVEGSRRSHLCFLLSLAKVGHPALSWEQLAQVLSKVRRKSGMDLSRALPLPDWLRKYIPSHPRPAHRYDFPVKVIEDPIVVSKKNCSRLRRYLARLVPLEPEKNLRRDISKLSRDLVYGRDAREAISKTRDRKALVYTFMTLQRKLQVKARSDLNGRPLEKVESRNLQQNTPDVLTDFENKLAEIATADPSVDWEVLKAVRAPEGTEPVDSFVELLSLVDRVCECFERYVSIYGNGHTGHLRPTEGRRGGFRGPVTDWNTAVDVLVELRRRIDWALFGIVEEEEEEEDVDGFTLIGDFKGITMAEMEIPKVDKLLALDIMSCNGSWRDDVFAVEKMPPQWWKWLQQRREVGVVAKSDYEIILD